jgi:chromosome segregation ATPase
MQKTWNWIKDNAAPVAVIITILGGFAGIIQFSVVRPIHQRFDAQDKYINQRFDAQDKRTDDLKAEINQRFDAQDKRIDDLKAEINQRFDAQDKYINQRFDAVDQRFDAQDKRIEDLAKDVSEFRKLSERVSRNETRIDTIKEQLQAADAPAP